MKATARPKAPTKSSTTATAKPATKQKAEAKTAARPQAAAKAVKVESKTAPKPAPKADAMPVANVAAKPAAPAAKASLASAPKPAAPVAAAKPVPAPPPAPPSVAPVRAAVPPHAAHRPPHRPAAAAATVATATKAAPRSKEEFKAGDHVVYPTHGVGTVQGIETVEAAGYSLQVIVVTFEENRMTLRVPVNKAASSGLRKLAAGASMQQALDTLKGRARIKRTMWSRRAQEYEAKINSGDPLQIAEVVRDLHRNAGQPDQSFSERQIYEQALDRLAAEVAAIDKTDKTKAIEKLLTYLGKAEKGEKGDKTAKADLEAESED